MGNVENLERLEKKVKNFGKSVPLLCHHEKRAYKPAKAPLGRSARAVLENGPRKQVCPF